MGQDVSGEPQGPAASRAFTRALLRDLRALEMLVDRGCIESGVRRIGAEQEMFLVDDRWRPAPLAIEVMEQLDGPYATELALYNLEANAEPLLLSGRCFSDLQARVTELVATAQSAAGRVGGKVLLTGILPTLSASDVTLNNITPKARYHALNEAFNRMRAGRPYSLHIDGWEELHLQSESVMLESCNTSFQVHLQVAPDEFAHIYNVAQVMTAPVMAASVNSPLLFGKHLWQETRIALFQQSVDTRVGLMHMREMAPRVHFGGGWVERSATELFEEDISRFRVALTREVDEDPIAAVEDGRAPKLQALQLHNSTLYRWNRPCYGILDGKPHLRIECRVLPAGPSVVDEVANGAFWIGLVLGAAATFADIRDRIDFEDAKTNFFAAARHGLGAGFRWLDGRVVGARELILTEALPMAKAGLESADVDAGDIERYLGIVEDRVRSGATGARWLLSSLGGARERGTRAEWLSAVTAATFFRQGSGEPCHLWERADLDESGEDRLSYALVEQFMTTSLFTVHEDELVDMVAFLMDRKQIRHVLVEDDEHGLVGLVSYRSLLRLMAEGFEGSVEDAPPVKAIMERDPISVGPDTTTMEAIELMRTKRVSCLPVVSAGRLVGIVSERDILPIAYELLRDRLRSE